MFHGLQNDYHLPMKSRGISWQLSLPNDRYEVRHSFHMNKSTERLVSHGGANPDFVSNSTSVVAR